MKKILILVLLFMGSNTFSYAQKDSLQAKVDPDTKTHLGLKGSLLYQHFSPAPNTYHYISQPAIAIVGKRRSSFGEAELSFFRNFGSSNSNFLLGVLRLQYNHYLISKKKFKPYGGIGAVITERYSYSTQDITLEAYTSNTITASLQPVIGLQLNFRRTFLDVSIPLDVVSVSRTTWSSNANSSALIDRTYVAVVSQPFITKFLRVGFGVWF